MEVSQCKENKAESVQLLSSAKLSLKQLITRVKVSEFIFLFPSRLKMEFSEPVSLISIETFSYDLGKVSSLQFDLDVTMVEQIGSFASQSRVNVVK